VERPALAIELARLAAHDLAVRQRLAESGELFGGYHPQMRAVHRHNGDRLMVVLDELGCWPGFRLVGVDGSEAAFLIAQHDIANPALMRRARDLYSTAVDAADADPARLANLEDRIQYLQGQNQRYGTHFGWNADGHFGPWPEVDEPASVDTRRRQLGLEPLAEALAVAAVDRQLVRPVEEVVEEHRQADEFATDAGWRVTED